MSKKQPVAVVTDSPAPEVPQETQVESPKEVVSEATPIEPDPVITTQEVVTETPEAAPIEPVPAPPLNKTIDDIDLKEGDTNLAGKVKSPEEKNEQISQMTEGEKADLPENPAPLDETLLDSRGAISPQAMEELKVKKKDIQKAIEDDEEEVSVEGARLHIKAALRMTEILALGNDELPEITGRIRSALILFESQYPVA